MPYAGSLQTMKDAFDRESFSIFFFREKKNMEYRDDNSAKANRKFLLVTKEKAHFFWTQ